MVEVGDGVAVVIGYEGFHRAIAPGVVIVGGDHASRDVAVQTDDVPLGVVHEVIASGRCLICLVHRNPVHAPAGIHQWSHVEPVAPVEAQEHPVIVIILRGDGSCNRIEGLFRPGSVDIILIIRRYRALAEACQLPPVAPGNACERRQWRMQRAGVGAAVGDWLGGLPPQTEPGTARGSSHPGIAADSQWYRRCRFHQYFVYANL